MVTKAKLEIICRLLCEVKKKLGKFGNLKRKKNWFEKFGNLFEDLLTFCLRFIDISSFIYMNVNKSSNDSEKFFEH